MFSILSPNSRKQGSQPFPEDEVDPREIDKVLSELAGMTGRWGLFRHFLWDRLKVHDLQSLSFPRPYEPDPDFRMIMT